MLSNTKSLNRREFFKTAALGIGSLVVMSIVPKASAAQQTLKTTIAKNHGHVLAVTFDELFRNGPKVYNIKGNSLHSHKVTVTQEILLALQKEKVIEVETSSDFAHDHILRLELI